MNLLELMLGIRNLDLVLPEFQREYVWEKEQAKQLMVSLFKDYPTGSLLFKGRQGHVFTFHIGAWHGIRSPRPKDSHFPPSFQIPS